MLLCSPAPLWDHVFPKMQLRFVVSYASSEYSLMITHSLLYFAKVISFFSHGIWYATSVPGVKCMLHYTEMFPMKMNKVMGQVCQSQQGLDAADGLILGIH